MALQFVALSQVQGAIPPEPISYSLTPAVVCDKWNAMYRKLN